MSNSIPSACTGRQGISIAQETDDAMYIETIEKFAAVGQHKVDMIRNHLPAFFIVR